jgi:1-acyl-sn-glycerol-3-phosphate acyltransferase
MLALRSVIFNIAFYVNLITALLLSLPLMLVGRRAVLELARYWGRSSLWLARVICGMRFEVRGLENIRPGALIVASKHQSIWETFTLPIFFDDFSYILKRELTWIPLFGWYLWRAEQVGINRGKGSSALAQVAAAARRIFADGRQLFIFPEGTRRPAGAPPAYKYGAAYVYAHAQTPCLPVALNSGLFWARRSFLRRPGVVVLSFLPIIEPGLDARSFLTRLTDDIETETNKLNAEALARDPSLAAVLAKGAAADETA